MKTKICKECGKEKPIQDFYIHKGYKDNHLNICKSCMCNRAKNKYSSNENNEKQKNKLFDLYSKHFCRIDNNIYMRLPKKLHIDLMKNYINKSFLELAYDGIILPPVEMLYENYKEYLKKNNYTDKDWIPFELTQEFLCFSEETIKEHKEMLDNTLKEIGI